jgi:hypothetical protein
MVVGKKKRENILTKFKMAKIFTQPKYNIVSKFKTRQIRHCSIRLVVYVNKMPKSEMG